MVPGAFDGELIPLGLIFSQHVSDPEPWQMKSMFVQSTRVAEALGDPTIEGELGRIFREEGSRSFEQG